MLFYGVLLWFCVCFVVVLWLFGTFLAIFSHFQSLLSVSPFFFCLFGLILSHFSPHFPFFLNPSHVGEAIKNNPGFLQLRRLEAAREIAVILRNSTNKVYLDASSLLLNVADDKLLKESLGTSAR